MSGFRKVVITTLIIASVAIGIGAYVIFESGLGAGEIADNFRRLFNENNININLGTGVDVSEESSYPLAGKRNIRLETPVGDLRVTGYDGDEIMFNLEGKVPERYLDRYLTIDESSDELSIYLYKDINGLNFSMGGNYDLDMELMIPVEYLGDVEFENVSGEITIDGINAKEVNVDNISGDIILENGSHEKIDFATISGQFLSYSAVNHLEGDSISGKITATGVKESFNLESVSGSINITALDLRSDSDIETISGAVTVEFEESEEIGYELSSVSGKISVEDESGVSQSSQSLRKTAGSRPKLEVSTVSGRITIKY